MYLMISIILLYYDLSFRPITLICDCVCMCDIYMYIYQLCKFTPSLLVLDFLMYSLSNTLKSLYNYLFTLTITHVYSEVKNTLKDFSNFDSNILYTCDMCFFVYKCDSHTYKYTHIYIHILMCVFPYSLQVFTLIFYFDFLHLTKRVVFEVVQIL